MKKYAHQEIESRWQEQWESTKLYKTSDDTSAPKYYVLDMFPYPSGSGLHVGHPKGYIATDVMARMKAMQGFNVLHPMGWDAFGLPAENYAINNKVHPRQAVEENIQNFKDQLHKLGLTYDWDREINTTELEYYKWTQWIFLKLLEKNLAYESFEPINWCPSCQTGLANEDLEEGKCERCGSEIEKKPMRQWVLKITDYADRLLDDLDKLPGWENSIKEMQRNWIGRKEGASVNFQVIVKGKPLEGDNSYIKVFTTRPDTLAGVTYVVVSPEHQMINELVELSGNSEEIRKYIEKAINKTDLERTDLNKDKTGVMLKGIFIINPLTGELTPIYVADYVLKNYGTGAVMGVPAHDERDFEFAKKYNLPIKEVVQSAKNGSELPFTSDGISINSGFLSGLTTKEATDKIINWLEEQGFGKRDRSYHLQDWVFSRQRYWGEPIPVIHCDKCGTVPVPEEDLPVKLPEVKNYEPTGTGESPLANIDEWVHTSCPKCGGQADRETNTMPQWAGSSWYWLRYMDPKNDEVLVNKKKEAYWSPVDQYVGGAEHATRHLIYARFWYKFLHDIKVVNYDEPFTRLQHVGLVLAEDGRKMSKRFNNVINPDDVVSKYGADALRVYEMFMGQFGSPTAWDTRGVVGVYKFLEKSWNLKQKVDQSTEENESLEKAIHKTIKTVSSDIEHFKFNTAVSKLMILVNIMTKQDKILKDHYKTLLILLHPFAPHMTEELWSQIGEKYSIYNTSWPEHDESKLERTNFAVGILVNGKVRGEIQVNKDDEEEAIKQTALGLESVQKVLSGKEVVKVIYVSGRIVNIVTK